MPAAKNPNRVKLVQVAKSEGVTIWDVQTRDSGIVLGDVRKLHDAHGGNPYLIGLRRAVVGGFATRDAAVRELVSRAKRAVSAAEA